MGGATLRDVPEVLRCRSYHAAAATARLSLAIGTVLTLLTAPAAAWADAPATPLSGLRAAVPAAAPVRVGPVRVPYAQPADTAPGSTNAATVRPATREHRPPAASTDPVLTRIARISSEAEMISERLTEETAALDALTTTHNATLDDLTAARTSTAKAATAAATWTRESFIAEASRPPGLVADPRSGMLGQPGLGPAVLTLQTAEAQQRTATEAADRLGVAVATQRARIAELRSDLAQRSTDLRRLRAARASTLIEAQRRRDASEAALARKYLRDAQGAAGKAALSAVGFALAQRGKPYEWGAEGPDRFDCSGLVQTAYATADVPLPRTARPQYRATQAVPVTALLPGDLLFFATDRTNWDTIHHVGVYLGNNLMVHAPTTGDVVRVAPVWWSEFFAAGRVVPGRPGARTVPPAQAALRADLPGAKQPSPRSTPERSAARRSATPAPSSTSPAASADPTTASPSASGKTAGPTTSGATSAERRRTTRSPSPHGSRTAGSPTPAGRSRSESSAPSRAAESPSAKGGRSTARSTAATPIGPADPDEPSPPRSPRSPEEPPRTTGTGRPTGNSER